MQLKLAIKGEVVLTDELAQALGAIGGAPRAALVDLRCPARSSPGSCRRSASGSRRSSREMIKIGRGSTGRGRRPSG